MKNAWSAVLILLLALPIAGIGTFLLVPFWRWFEAATAIESLGHSGPAAWCFGAAYGLALLLGFGTWCYAHGRTDRNAGP